jgi:transposase
MNISLSPDQIVFLKVLHKKQKEKAKADRIKIVLLLDQGFTNEEVSNILLIDADTVSKWKSRFLERTDDTLWFCDNYKPYFGKLSCCEISLLRAYINTFKVPNKSELLAFLGESFGVSYKKSGLQKLFHRIGLSYKKIHKLPGGLDVEKQTAFLIYMKSVIDGLADNQSMVFIDGVHPQHNSNSSKMWIEKGTERWISSNTGRKHLNINGAYNPLTQDVIITEAPTINDGATISLLSKVVEKYHDKELVYVFADNAAYNKSENVKAFIRSEPKIRMVYLPPYSPNLNLIERLWKFMKEKTVNLKFYPTFSEFREALISFFNNIGIYKKELTQRITLNFQTFNDAIGAR